MKTAVVYARYSCDNQTEQSIEGQLHVCEQYAKNNGILILNTYIDRAMTGTNDNRPDFQKMIKDSNDKDFEYVIVYKLDRFSRNKYETAKYKKILKDNGVKLLSAMENIPDTPEGIILESLLEGMAEYYSVELAQKIKRGMNETRLKGNFTGGTILYGYKVENHKVLINEEEAEVVRYIYKQYALGFFVKDIMEELNRRGIYRNGKPFARNTIYEILKNEKYSGIYRFNNEIYNNIFPRIIPVEIYEQVRRKTEMNRYGKRSTEVTYLLKNKLVCGYCGQTVTGETGTSQNGHVTRYYKCFGRKHHNGCTKSCLRKEDFENYIVEIITNILSKPRNISILTNKLLEVQENNDIKSSTIKILKRKKKQAESAIENIMKAIEQGIINKSTNDRIKALEKDIEEYEKQITLENAKSDLKVTKEDIKTYFNKALKNEAFSLINYAVKIIKVYDDKIEITFNSPTLQNPDENQGFFVFAYNSKYPKFIQHKPKPMLIDTEIKVYV